MFVIWLTGLSGSGKTTVAKAIIDKMYKKFGVSIQLLDGEELRKDFTYDLDYSVEGQKEALRRVIFLAKILCGNGVPSIVAYVSPFKDIKLFARDTIEKIDGIFLEFAIHAHMETLKLRDTKGLYSNPNIQDLPGVSFAYEGTRKEDRYFDTDKISSDEISDKIIDILYEKILRKYGKIRLDAMNLFMRNYENARNTS